MRRDEPRPHRIGLLARNSMPATLARTALYDAHLGLHARMVPFAGWEMPVQYTGIVAEHRAVRSSWGLFDVSHMGRIEVQGPGAALLLDCLLTAGVAGLREGRGRYSLLCLESGGILDDLVAFRLGEERFLLVCNAANRAAVLGWVRARAGAFPPAAIVDRTEQTVMLAAQGPRAAEHVDPLFGGRLGGLRRFAGGEFDWHGATAIVSRTGYTGEDGFEVIADSDAGRALWARLVEAGATPCGLGARDTLRLEAGLLLHGQDMDRTVNPVEAGLERFVRMDGGDFIGKGALLESMRQGLERRLIGFKTAERGAVPRHGFPIVDRGHRVGQVTSGAFSPTIGTSIGLGYASPDRATPGRTLQVEVRGSLVDVVVAELPFYRRTLS